MFKLNHQLLPVFSIKEISRFIFILLCVFLFILSIILFTNYHSTKEKLILSTLHNFNVRASVLENELNLVINHVKTVKIHHGKKGIPDVSAHKESHGNKDQGNGKT